jgi:hypothetical protein
LTLSLVIGLFAALPMTASAAGVGIEAGLPAGSDTPSVVTGHPAADGKGYTTALDDPSDGSLPHPTGPALTQSTKIGYAGHQWVVIGWDGNGVASKANTATLLLGKADTLKPPTITFNSSNSNDYKDSNLQKADSDFFNTFPSKEQSGTLVLPRDLEGGSSDFEISSQSENNITEITSLGAVTYSTWDYDGDEYKYDYCGLIFNVEDGTTFVWYAYDAYRQTHQSNYEGGYHPDKVAGSTITAAALWPLSVAEASLLAPTIRAYGEPWWLRNPGRTYGGIRAAAVDGNGTVDTYGDYVYDNPGTEDAADADAKAPRPALNLDLSSVLFSSAANGDNVKTPDVGDNFVPAILPDVKTDKLCGSNHRH